MRYMMQAASELKSKDDPIRFLIDALANAVAFPRRPADDPDSGADAVGFPYGVRAKEEGNATAARKWNKKKRKKKDEGGQACEAIHGDWLWLCGNSCFGLGEAWSALIRGFYQALPSQFKSKDEVERLKPTCGSVVPVKDPMPLGPFPLFVLGSSDWSLEVLHDSVRKVAVGAKRSWPLCADDSRILGGVTDKKGSNVLDAFLSNVGFARVRRTVKGLTESSAAENEVNEANRGVRTEMVPAPPRKVPNAFLSTSLANIEKLRSTLSVVPLRELLDSLPHLPPSSLPTPATSHPDKKKLLAVQDFFRYAETEGRRLFEELDRDGDGRITLEDLEIAMNRRRLPKKYARQFLRHSRTHLLSRSIGWKQFLALMEQKEPTILRAYTSFCLNKSGTVEKSEILSYLRSAGLQATEDNAVSVIQYLNSDAGESISYRHFRNFMILLPSDRLHGDPRLQLMSHHFAAQPWGRRNNENSIFANRRESRNYIVVDVFVHWINYKRS